MVDMASSKRVAIVTGANSGMGKALAQHLVHQGWHVAIADIMENEDFAKELGEAASFYKCDVADYHSQAETFQKVFDKYGRIDALCANAGIVDKSSIYILDHRGSDQIPPKPNLLCTDVDYKGVVYGTQLAIHFMRKNAGEAGPGGRIVCTASVAGIVPHPSYPEYNGAKAAVVNFVRGVAQVLKNVRQVQNTVALTDPAQKDNISINAVCPGIVDTSIIPQAMIDAVSPECLTPVSTIVAAYERCLNDGSLYGKVVECSADKQFFLETPPLANGSVSARAVTVWDPLFKM